MSCIFVSGACASSHKDLEAIGEISITNIKHLEDSSNKKSYIYDIFNESNTIYDEVFWIVLASFILYVVYMRARTNFRLDYPDEDESPFYSAIIKYRKIVAPDPYLDTEKKKFDIMSTFENGPLIAFWIFLYSVAIFSFDDVFGATYKHIEDLTSLVFALFINCSNIVVCCIVFDLCSSAPMKYYEE
ncbi:uncharacterized protein LOC123307886 isoform X2 [Coccinella septempunctata]|nr:uncharacterized protein LOC123307886 isoform X2 [Coccinella septempunctata]